MELYLHFPNMSCMVWCLVKYRDNFTFTSRKPECETGTGFNLLWIRAVVNTVMNLCFPSKQEV
jgi:heme/copper-type cytochrome/quinol oxidase subunit 2